MGGGLEAAYVGAGLGDDGRRAQVTDAGKGARQTHRDAERPTSKPKSHGETPKEGPLRIAAGAFDAALNWFGDAVAPPCAWCRRNDPDPHGQAALRLCEWMLMSISRDATPSRIGCRTSLGEVIDAKREISGRPESVVSMTSIDLLYPSHPLRNTPGGCFRGRAGGEETKNDNITLYRSIGILSVGLSPSLKPFLYADPLVRRPRITLSGCRRYISVFSGPTLAASPFAGFAGTWSGDGNIQTDSEREAITCKAHYTTTAGGGALNINVNCASDSYRVNIISDVVVQGDTFSGTWQETTRQISGDVSGRISEPNTFQAKLQTVGGGLQLEARTNGERQAITITSQGSDITGATITLKRR